MIMKKMNEYESEESPTNEEIMAMLKKIGAKEIKYPPGTFFIMPFRKAKE